MLVSYSNIALQKYKKINLLKRFLHYRINTVFNYFIKSFKAFRKIHFLEQIFLCKKV